MNNPLNVIFAGTPDFAALHLKALIDSSVCKVVAVYTQPDRPAGRGKKLTPSPVKQLALEHHLPVYQPKSLKNEDEQQLMADLNADLMVVVAYGLILPAAILQTPRLGCINVHASLLPRWRGAAPIQRAIEAGDSETGVTIMQMDEGLDTGDMLLVSKCSIEADETAASLHDKLAYIGCPALIESIQTLSQNQAKPKPQDNNQSTYADKLTKQEAEINWQLPAQTLDLKIRAYNPFPTAFTQISGSRIKVWQAKLCTDSSDKPCGTILSANTNGILVKCGQDALLLEQIQLPGKKRLAVADILNANSDLFAVGQCFDIRQNS